MAIPARHVHRAARCSVDHQRQPRSGRAQVTCRPETHERAAVSREQRYVDARLRRGGLHHLSGASVSVRPVATLKQASSFYHTTPCKRRILHTNAVRLSVYHFVRHMIYVETDKHIVKLLIALYRHHSNVLKTNIEETSKRGRPQ